MFLQVLVETAACCEDSYSTQGAWIINWNFHSLNIDSLMRNICSES